MRLLPGDKVRITQHFFDNIDVVDLIIATKGSTGTVLSYSEYRDYYVNKNNVTLYPSNKLLLELMDYPYPLDDNLGHVRNSIINGERYPIRFDTVAPLSKEYISSWDEPGKLQLHNNCEVGKIEILEIEILEKIT